MEVRKGYKQTEAGMIPEDWELSNLINIVCKVIDNRGKTPPYSSNSEIELIETTSISFSRQYPDYSKVTKWVTESTFKTWFRAHPEKDDILVSTVGEYSGSSAIMRENRGTIAQNLIAIRISIVNSMYVYYWSISQLFSKQLKQVMMNQAQPSLRVPWLLGFKVPLPPRPEQTAIATALSDTDALIQSLEKLIAKKRAIKQGAQQELLTGKRRLTGFEKKKGFQKTEIGEIPADWQLKSFSELFNISGGYSASRDQLSDTGYSYLHYGDIHTSNKIFVDVKHEFSNIPKLNIALGRISSKSLLADGDIVFVDASEDDDGTSKHIVVRNKENIPYISGLHTIVAKSKTDEMDNLFKEFCFQTKYIKKQFYYYAVGTKVSGISKSNIAKVYLPLPGKEEQAAIASILSDMDAELTALESKLSKYRTIKQGMMQELLTGKTRLV